LKQASVPFSTSQLEKRGFRIALIFPGLQAAKMAAALYRAACRKTWFFNRLPVMTQNSLKIEK
jgi:hypothetical protein